MKDKSPKHPRGIPIGPPRRWNSSLEGEVIYKAIFNFMRRLMPSNINGPMYYFIYWQ